MRKSIIVLSLVAACLLTPLAFAQDASAENQIKALSDQLAQAYIKGDTSFWEKYLADDYIGVYASGQKYTKSESVQPGALKYESFDVRESKIRVYGNTAVVNQLTSATGTVRKDGKPFTGLYRTTRVWVKEKDGWKLVSFQSTQVPTSQ